jgi:Mce-associated membrane protein
VLGRLVRNRFLAAGAVVVLVVLLGFEFKALGSGGGLPHAPAASRDVARQFGVAVTSFDYRQVDADIARVLALGGPGFETDFRNAMGANFVDGIKTNKRISTGHVALGPTVQRVANGRATFLVVVSQQIVSDGSNTPPQSLRVAMLVTVTTSSRPLVQSVQVL